MEVVIDEDQDAERDGSQLGALAGLDASGSPVAESRAAAGAVHQLHDRSENDQEDQDADVPSVGKRSDDTIIEDMGHRSLKVEA